MDYNYHTHTFRCNHATGVPEEYVVRAVEGGVKYMGFSEHIPLRNPDGTDDFYRLKCDELSDYVSDISNLRDKYRDKIEIRMGFEAEYYPEHIDEMLSMARGCEAEYLILGQHFLHPAYTGAIPCSYPTGDVQRLDEYTNTVVEAMHLGIFSYVAHPDLIGFQGDGDAYARSMRRICRAARLCDVPLEINFLGIREGRRYPCENFWRIAAEEGAPVTFGFDAHASEDAYDEKSMKIAYDTVHRLSLNYIGRPRLINIKNVR